MAKLHKIKLSTDHLNQDQEIVIAKFARSHLFKEDSLKAVRYLSDKKNDAKSFKRKILIVENDKLKYAATNFGPDAKRHLTSSKYYVGLLNRKSNKMRIVNAAMYDLRPTILGNLFGEQKVAEEKTNKELNVRDELTKAFGSLKKQRAMESRIKYQVDTENVTDVMQKAIENVNVTEIGQEIKQLESAKKSVEEFLPPINRNAAKVEDVYDLNDLIVISEDQLEELETASSVFIDATDDDIKQWQKENTYPKFVLKLLAEVPIKSQIRIEKCRTLMYMNYLWQLLQLQASQLKKKDFLPEVPDMIRDQLMTKFFQLSAAHYKSGPVWKSMTAQQKDCLLAYIIVLNLVMNKFSFMSADLMPDLKTSQVKFSTLVRAVGAKIEKGSGKLNKADKVTLSIPLTVLETKLQRNRRT